MSAAVEKKRAGRFDVWRGALGADAQWHVCRNEEIEQRTKQQQQQQQKHKQKQQQQ